MSMTRIRCTVDDDPTNALFKSRPYHFFARQYNFYSNEQAIFLTLQNVSTKTFFLLIGLFQKGEQATIDIQT